MTVQAVAQTQTIIDSMEAAVVGRAGVMSRPALLC
jgi:hypothetical protein